MASLRAQPILPPSQIMPVRLPLMLMMAAPIWASSPPSSHTMAAEAAAAADTPQPQVALSLPVKILMYTLSRWEKARAFSVASLLAPTCLAISTTGMMAVMPWLPLPALLMTA